MRTAWQTSRVDTQQQHVRELVTVRLSAHAHTAARVRTGNAYHTPRSALHANVKIVLLDITHTYWLWDSKPCSHCHCEQGLCAYCCDMKKCQRAIPKSAEVTEWIQKKELHQQMLEFLKEGKKAAMLVLTVLYVLFAICYIYFCAPPAHQTVPKDEYNEEKSSLVQSSKKSPDYSGALATDQEATIPNSKRVSPPANIHCKNFTRSLEFLGALEKLSTAKITPKSGAKKFRFYPYLDPQQNRCFCSDCYPATKPTVVRDGRMGTEHVVPVGWCLLGLKLPPR